MGIREKALDTWNSLKTFGAKKKEPVQAKKADTPLDKLKSGVSAGSTAGTLRDAEARRKKALEDAGA